MTCAVCGAENQADKRFCGDCGAPLAAACPNCGATNQPGKRFCGDCGTPLVAGVAPAPSTSVSAAASAASPAAVSERRLVSVLFADLVGFTSWSEGRDSEETRELLTRYFDLAREVIGRYGGTVEKFIGDAVMAVWGTPTAHEDDAERSVRAALDLVDGIPRLGPGIQARAGILTGEAAVTLGATNQGMVAGDIVNTASRLQSAAAPGAVLVGEATFRAASKAIAFERQTDQTMKGKAAPVPSWQALRIIAEVGGRKRADTLEPPFVGRDEELRQVKELFHSTARDGRARLVSVTGPAGMGKTRLIWEFEKYLDGMVVDVWWHAGRSPSYGDGVTFWALGEMVRRRLGVAETDDEATTRTKVAAGITEFIPDAQERAWIEPALLALLGFDSDTGGQQLFAAWRTFFERLAGTFPVVMVFEDFQYADPGLMDFVDHLLDWSRSVPIFVITMARPELLERRPGWGGGKRNFSSVYLEPLEPAEIRTLLTSLVTRLPEATLRHLVERADGVPLYAVETVRMLIADGRLRLAGDTYEVVGELTGLAVPETLIALIASRVDGLQPELRGLIQDAAVLGQSFTPAALAAVAGTSEAELIGRLDALVQRELLRRESDARNPEFGQYAFVQALIREVAYNTLSHRDRKNRHLAAARFFEGLGNEELVGALAGHYLAAYRNSGAGPESDAAAAQARISLKAAAERASALGSPAQALTFLQQALEVASDPAERLEIMERAGKAAGESGHFEVGEPLLRQALEGHMAHGDRDASLRAVTTLAKGLISAGHTAAALATIREFSGPAMQLGSDLEIALSGQQARALFLLERLPEAIQASEAVLEAAERANLVEIVADTLITKGSAMAFAGRFIESLALIRAGQDLAESRGFPSALRGYINASGIFLATDYRAGIESARAGIALARKMGSAPSEIPLLANAAEFATRLGEWDWATSELTQRYSDDLEANDQIGMLHFPAALAAYRGEPVTEVVERMRSLVEGSTDIQALYEVADLEGSVAFAAGDMRGAVAAWIRVTEIKPSQRMETLPLAARAAAWEGDTTLAKTILEQFVALGLHGPAMDMDTTVMRARVAALEGRQAEAAADFAKALRAAEALGLRMEQALLPLDMAMLLGPEAPGVREAAEQARAILVELGAKPFIERLDALMDAPTAVSRGTRVEVSDNIAVTS